MRTRSLLLWLPIAIAIAIPTVYFAIEDPSIILVLFIAAAGLGTLGAVKTWWRRSYILVLLTTSIGASAIEALATIGTMTKTFAVLLLLVITHLESSGEEPAYANKLHKLTLVALWVTAGAAMVSLIWSESRPETLTDGGIVVILVYVLHKTSTVRWQHQNTMKHDIMMAYWMLTIYLGIGSVLAFASFPETVGGAGRHQGLYANPNLLGIVAVVTLAVGIGVASAKRVPLVWASLLIPATSIVMSQSRTAILAALIGITWALVRANFLRVFAIVLVAGISVLIIKVTGAAPFEDAVSRFTDAEDGNLLNSRTNAWQDAIWNVQNNPLGAGWAATREAMTALYEAGLINSGIFTMHNSWFQILNELGWIGLIPITLLLAATVGVILTANPKGLGTGLVGATFAGSMTHLTESAMFGIGGPYPYLFWFVVLAAAVSTGPPSEPESRSQANGRPSSKEALAPSG